MCPFLFLEATSSTLEMASSWLPVGVIRVAPSHDHVIVATGFPPYMVHVRVTLLPSIIGPTGVCVIVGDVVGWSKIKWDSFWNNNKYFYHVNDFLYFINLINFLMYLIVYNYFSHLDLTCAFFLIFFLFHDSFHKCIKTIYIWQIQSLYFAWVEDTLHKMYIHQ
jgi:hypothetical protein